MIHPVRLTDEEVDRCRVFAEALVGRVRERHGKKAPKAYIDVDLQAAGKRCEVGAARFCGLGADALDWEIHDWAKVDPDFLLEIGPGAKPWSVDVKGTQLRHPRLLIWPQPKNNTKMWLNMASAMIAAGSPDDEMDLVNLAGWQRRGWFTDHHKTAEKGNALNLIPGTRYTEELLDMQILLNILEEQRHEHHTKSTNA